MRRALNAPMGVVHRELIRLHLMARAVAPYLPGPVFRSLQRGRRLINRSRGWHWLKAGGSLSGAPDALVAKVFDADFYVDTYGRSLRGRAPLDHYRDVGWRRRNDPSPMFSTGWYLDHFVAEGNEPVEPLEHYLTVGWREGRDPSPWFSTRWYSTVNADIGPDTNPLVHYVERGYVEGRTVSESHTTALLGSQRGGRASRPVGFEGMVLLNDEDGGVEITPRTVAADGHDLVTFDVWDTLLVRDRPADTAKVATARRMALAVNQPGRTWQLFEQRVAVEAAMAAEVIHEEYELQNVLARTISEAGLDVDDPVALSRELADAELDDELEWTTPVPEAFAMVHRLASAPDGPAVIALSDFYIGCEGLARLLRHHGLGSDRISVVCSVDEGASKRLGTLYEIVQKRYDAAPSRHLHIGDNRHSDGTMARAAGADAIVVTPHDRRLPGPGALTRDWYADAVEELEAELDDVAATTVGQSSATLARRTAFAAGVRAAAIVVPYVAGAIERTLEVGVDTVHYLSREGASAARIHSQIAKVLFGDHAPHAVHLEVSRRSTFGASLQSLDDEHLRRMWRQYPDQSPSGLLTSLGLDVAGFQEPLRRAGLDPDVLIRGIEEDLRVRQFLDRPEVSSSIWSALRAQRTALLRYLEDRGFSSERDVVVDVGWRGTIQDNLCHLLEGTEIHGVYLGLFPYFNPQPSNGTKRAIVFDGNRGEPFDYVSPPAAIEAPLTPPVPTVVGYAEVGGRIEPLLQPEQGRADELVDAFQAGLRLGAPAAARRYRSWGATSELLRRGLQASLRRYYREPAPGVADIWFFSSHDDTFGALNVTPYGKSQPTMELTYGSVEPTERSGAALSQWPEGWAAWLPVRALEVIRQQRRGSV